jgi:hypothetical protein
VTLAISNTSRASPATFGDQEGKCIQPIRNKENVVKIKLLIGEMFLESNK